MEPASVPALAGSNVVVLELQCRSPVYTEKDLVKLLSKEGLECVSVETKVSYWIVAKGPFDKVEAFAKRCPSWVHSIRSDDARLAAYNTTATTRQVALRQLASPSSPATVWVPGSEQQHQLCGRH